MTTELQARPESGTSAENADKTELIKNTICKGATDDELELFLHVANKYRLDPLVGQLHAVKRYDSASGKQKMSIQIGIDGLRTIAERTGQYAGSDEPRYDSETGPHPARATVTVYRIVGGIRCPFSATARWSEYVQTGRDGAPMHMWRRMPYLMLGKCAEALALRKAFPADLSGLYTTDEMGQADNLPPQEREVPPVIQPAPARDSRDPAPALSDADRLNALRDNLKMVIELSRLDKIRDRWEAATGFKLPETKSKGYAEIQAKFDELTKDDEAPT